VSCEIVSAFITCARLKRWAQYSRFYRQFDGDAPSVLRAEHAARRQDGAR